ncbi:MAG: ubiquinol-cytochrome C chaperone [Rhizobiales bacterium PAR1]|nr:MAG: ubiquinol-cytochrome C chaperone [Rhizobiales bacterium PAR1]
MISFPFFKPRKDPVAALYGDIVAASRAPEAYRVFGVADTFEGRFERLALVTTLVLRRLQTMPPPAAALAQELVDRIFAGLDEGLRLAGVGDLSVGKKVKKLAQGFYGRAEAYTAALEAGEATLRDALSRNLLAGRVPPDAVSQGLLDEIAGLNARLEAASLESLLAGGVLSAHYS